MIHDYPMRPDPVKTASAYTSWLRSVSKPVTVIPPVIAPLTRHHTQTATANIWSGFMDTSPNVGYSIAWGRWNVPTITPDPNQDTDTSIWVGIDGFNLVDLWQAGTEQFSPKGGGPPQYYAWFEFLPPEGTEVGVPTGQNASGQIVNFPVNPGDQVGAAVMVGDANMSPTVGGTVLWYYVANDTQGVSTPWTAAPISPDQVTAAAMSQSEVEWIVERASSGGTPLALANYGQVSFDNLLFFDNSGWNPVQPINDATTQI
jgi:Peptidase A4 family